MKMHNVVSDVSDWLKTVHAMTMLTEAELGAAASSTRHGNRRDRSTAAMRKTTAASLGGLWML